MALQTWENGAVISAIRFQARQQERVNLFLDGEFAFGLEATRAAPLRVGQRLTGAEIADLRAEDEISLALRRALRFLSYRPRSVAEVRRHLQKKRPMSEASREAALQRLTEQGYLDDAEFARFWLENRAAFRPSSRRALRYELRQKGVATEIIDARLEGWDDLKAALATLQANERRWSRSDETAFQKQAGAFLQRRGFSYADVTEALRQFREGGPDDSESASNPATQLEYEPLPQLVVDPRKE